MKKFSTKILGIHWRATVIASKNTLWNERADDIRKRWHQIYIPQFDESDDPMYEDWATQLEDLNIENYDCILAVSHGCWVLTRYIVENDKHLKRVVFCCPGRSVTKRDHTWRLYNWLDENKIDLATHVDEVFIIHGTSDEEVLYEEGVRFHKAVGWKMFALENFGHKLWEEAITFINDLAIKWENQF